MLFGSIVKQPSTNVPPVRLAGSFAEQLNLLHRDYLRADPAREGEYAGVKRSLAHLLLTDRRAYVDAKAPFVWDRHHRPRPRLGPANRLGARSPRCLTLGFKSEQ
jgi:GrpB protein